MFCFDQVEPFILIVRVASSGRNNMKQPKEMIKGGGEEGCRDVIDDEMVNLIRLGRSQRHTPLDDNSEHTEVFLPR